MHFILPPWLRHGRDARGSAASIFSVDIQPYGHRLATAGQDAAVKLWALPVLAALAAAPGDDEIGNDPPPGAGVDPSVAGGTLKHLDDSRLTGGGGGGGSGVGGGRARGRDRDRERAPEGSLLASVTGHAAAVNCVRWNPSGTLLASGGDDAVVLIYERCAGESRSSRAFGGGGGQGDEDWRVRRPLRAHAADVTDVCWSPDGERLASASVDNTIGIWSVRGETLIIQLRGHTGLVKGVAWDPVGRFLASQSDDRSVIVWRTADWAQEMELTDPFAGAIYPQNANVFYLRCSWSPCGSQLLTANGYEAPGADVAPMFSRTSGFKKHVYLVGHELPVVSTRFSPRLYRRSQRHHPANGTDVVRDGENLETAMKSNREQGDKLEEKNLRLNESDERGSPASGAPGTSMQSTPYTCLALGSKDSGASIWQASGDRAFFNMTEIFTQEVIDLSWGTDGYTLVACSPDGGLMYVRFDPSELGDVLPVEEEREILAKQWREFGGARDGAVLPETPGIVVMEKSRRLSAQPLTSPVVVPSSDPPISTQGNEQLFKTTPQPLAVLRQSNAEHTPPADPQVLAAQKEGRARSGKRRIIPAPVTANPMTTATGPISSLANDCNRASSGHVPSPLKRIRAGVSFDVPDRPANGLGAFEMHRTAPESSGGPSATGSGEREASLTPNAKSHDLGAVQKVGSSVAEPHRAPMYKPSVIGLSAMLLPESGSGSSRCRAIDLEVPPTLLEARELHGSSRGGGNMLMCSKGGVVQWRDYLPLESQIAALAGVANKFAAAGTVDGFLFIYSAASGRRLIPALVLDSSTHLLEAHAFDNEYWFLLVITRSGLCSVYDVLAKRLVCARSAAPLLARPVDATGHTADDEAGAVRTDIYRSIAVARVMPTGEPVLTLSDGFVYFYSRDFASWMQVAGSSMPNSEFARGIPAPSGVGIVRSLQGSAVSSLHAPSLSGMSDLRRAAVESLSHLETLMECALALSSASDYRYYLATYASRLAAASDDDVESADKRIRELCDSLLRVDIGARVSTILGMDSRALLRDVVLPVVSSNMSLQRIVSEYAESIEELQQKRSVLMADGAN